MQALRHLINHPNATIDDLMRFIPGPDLPTGGKIVGLDGIRDAYETGRGTFRMRATARIETVGRRKGIVVTELPYGVGTEKVVERIKTLVQGKKLQGIADVKDLTDRENGLRLVIEVKNGFVPEALLEQLYRQTPMEDSFGINNVALVDGQPRTLGLKELLQVFLDHRFDVVRRRSTFRRTKAADRLHLVDGLLIAILDIDEVIQLIRTSDNAAQARERLITVFDLTEMQANYILEMQLRRLTKFSKIELDKEKAELEREIEAARRDPRRRQAAAEGGLRRARRGRQDVRHPAAHRAARVGRHGGGHGRHHAAGGRRRPVLRADVVHRAAGPHRDRRAGRRGRGPHQPRRGRLRRRHHGPRRGRGADLGRPAAPARRPRPAGDPAVGQRPQPAGRAAAQRDAPARLRRARARRCARSPPTGRASRSAPGRASSSGSTRRCSASDEWDVIGLKDGDEVVGAVELTTGDETLCFITSDAQLLHFGADGVRPQGRSGGGIAGVKLGAGQHVVWFGALDPAASVVVTASGSSTALPGTEPGAVKVTPFSEYPAKGRATGGVRCHRFLKGEDTLVFAWAGTAPARAAAASGAPVDLPEADRPARRLRHPRQPADRGLRRPARGRGWGQPRRCGRLTACRIVTGWPRALSSPCSSPPACPRAATTAAVHREQERRRRRRRRRQPRGGHGAGAAPRSTRPAACS